MSRADKQAHTPGPWEIGGVTDLRDTAQGRLIASISKAREGFKDNALRIVACVNACEGVPTDGVDACKELGGLHFVLDALDKVTRDRKALQADNARLREALQGMLNLLDLEGNPPVRVDYVRATQSWMKATPHVEQARAALKVTA